MNNNTAKNPLKKGSVKETKLTETEKDLKSKTLLKESNDSLVVTKQDGETIPATDKGFSKEDKIPRLHNTEPMTINSLTNTYTEGDDFLVYYEEVEEVLLRDNQSNKDNYLEQEDNQELLEYLEDGWTIVSTKPNFVKIFPLLEKQLGVIFTLSKQLSYVYTIKNGSFKDLDEETKYGWYLELTDDTETFTQALTESLLNSNNT